MRAKKAIWLKGLAGALSLVLLTTVVVAEERPDFASYKDVKQKKKAFFDYINAYTVEENNKILKERALLSSSSRDSAELIKLCEKYSKNCSPITDEKMAELKTRIDIIPPSLALAQSANESAWGTSRFATQGNNFFGQWCYKKGCGIVPSRRNEGSSHEVRKFASGKESVRAYLLNLNTGRAYKDLRAKRAEDRAAGKTASSLHLAEGLINYSERREAYVEELQSMINYNKLVEKYDTPYLNTLK